MSYLFCLSCDRQYPDDHAKWRCDCGGLLDIFHKASFPVEKIKERKEDIWRYREAIPINDDSNIVSLGEGFTPLKTEIIFGREIRIKNDSLFPTRSYKDRGASVLISKVRELGIKSVVEDSSGNAGSAIACYSQKSGIECDIFVPESTSSGKIAMIERYGAKLHKIAGSREDTFKAAFQKAQTTYFASHSWNPYFFQGTKTCAFEIWEQLGYKIPDSIFIPVGNGTLLLGMYKGFCDLLVTGLTANTPKIIAVQAENCAPLTYLNKSGFTKKPTIAEGIAVAEPVRRDEILGAIKKSQGNIVTVTDQEIEQAVLYASELGYNIEPTSGTVLAALKNALNSIKPSEDVVIILTGHGIKS